MNTAKSTGSALAGAPETPASAAHYQAAAAGKRRVRHRRKLGRLFALVAGAGVLLWLGRLGIHAYHYVETDNAYVVGHLHQISPQVDGPVSAVPVEDNQQVQAGEVLLRIDPLEFQLGVRRAQAGLAQAQAQQEQSAAALPQAQASLAEARAKVAQAAAQITQTQSQVDLAQLALGRDEQLFRNGGAVTQADVDNARGAAAAAKGANEAAVANRDAAAAAVNSAEANLASARAQGAAATANVAAAQAAVADAERQLAYTTVTAPVAGRIGNKNVEVGNRVLAGQTVFALAEPQVWIVANFKETQLPRIRAGQEVTVTVDALPGTTLHGKVDSIAPASGAQFALLPPDNATGNFTKVVQRVPVKIVLDADSLRQSADRLRLGFSAIVNVRVR